jgi:acetate kinase
MKAPVHRTVLVLNAGSSSLKFSAYTVGAGDTPGTWDITENLVPGFDGEVEGIGSAPRMTVRDSTGPLLTNARWAPDPRVPGHVEALRQVGDWLAFHIIKLSLIGVGHRVVHGGPDHIAPVEISDPVLELLEHFVPLAPLHQPHNLAGIRAVAEALPGVRQVACFDTGFHRGHPWAADRFALPEAYHAEGVRRYGFHGLSYESIARALPSVAPEIAAGRVVVAHLGNGASMCAMQAGQSVDSTMGFTALDGLPMGTRCGAIDPGVLLYFMRSKGMTSAEIEDLLYNHSGLLGLSGVSHDMRALLASEDPRAAQAIDYFVYRIGRELGALAAVLGGLDGLVFTGGIGEHAAEIRARVCRNAAWLGVELDAAANQDHGPRITTPTSRASAWVIPTDEERVIARHTLDVLAGPAD